MKKNQTNIVKNNHKNANFKMDFNLENIEDIIKFNYKSSDGGNEKKV